MTENNSKIYPQLAKLIGFGGLVPFAGCAVTYVFRQPRSKHHCVICQCCLWGRYPQLCWRSPLGPDDARTDLPIGMFGLLYLPLWVGRRSFCLTSKISLLALPLHLLWHGLSTDKPV